jgi:hypothetical protein
MVEGDVYRPGVEQANVEATRLGKKMRQTQIVVELVAEWMDFVERFA